MKNFSFYSKHFLKNFIFDKYNFSNNYQMPRFLQIYLNASTSSNVVISKNQIYKMLIFLYCLSGVKPFIRIKKIKLKGSSLYKNSITSIFVNLQGEHLKNILMYLVTRQLCLIKFFQFFSLKRNKVFSFTLNNSINDDDLLLQLFRINENIRYEVSFIINSIHSFKLLKTFLIGLKIPINL